MKTLLLIVGLSFNILLCCYPFNEPLQTNKPSDKSEKITPAAENNYPERKPLAYSALLKDKASQLPKH